MVYFLWVGFRETDPWGPHWWMRGGLEAEMARWGSSVPRPGLPSPPIPLCAHERLFQGASLVFIPHLSGFRPQTWLSLQWWAAPFLATSTALSPSLYTQTIGWSPVDCFLWKSGMWSPRGNSSSLLYSFSSGKDRVWGRHTFVSEKGTENGLG